jgi:hypothetical protein
VAQLKEIVSNGLFENLSGFGKNTIRQVPILFLPFVLIFPVYILEMFVRL